MQEKTKEIYEVFQPSEGLNTVYYGKVRNGKTYAATKDIIDLIERGEIVYANWIIDFDDFDERKSFKIVLAKTLVGKKNFYVFKKENFHYINVTDPEHPAFKSIAELHKLVGVHVFIDEGQWIFNSHSRKDDVDARHLILEGGHYCRTLNVITQRPNNIYVDVRSQIQIWYKCEKVFQLGGLIRFDRTEIQEMKEDLPWQDPDARPLIKGYWASKRVYTRYETHGMRAQDAIIEPPKFDVYQTSFFDRIVLLASFFVPQSVRRSLSLLAKRSVHVAQSNGKDILSNKR